MKSFKCPECGSDKIRSELNVSTDPNSNDPWSKVLLQFECNGCHSYIPAHLGERWNNITYEEAKKEWLLKYKKNTY
jgi:hypothetical protein